MDIKSIKKGFVTSIPLIIGFLPLAFISGVLLNNAGLSTFQVLLMSIMVYAGSSHFVAASMIASGASIFSVVLTTFIINIRHLLYSSSLSSYVREKSIVKLALMAQQMTDEIYAINYEMYQEGSWNDDLSLICGSFGKAYWVVGAYLGSVIGDAIDIPAGIASFSLIAMFIILVTLQTNNSLKLLVVILTIPITIFVLSIYSGHFNVILATLISASIGYFLDLRRDRRG